LRTKNYDKQLIGHFLVGLNRVGDSDFRLKSYPDNDSSKPNVDAIAESARDQTRTIAIEHTLIEPFLEEKYDADRFWRVFGPLETDAALKFPDYDIVLYFQVGTLPNRFNADETCKRTASWVVSESGRWPFGESIHRIPGLPFEVNVVVDKKETVLGRVFVGRTGMPVASENVIESRFEAKLFKLVSCPASRRILLLES